MKEKQIKYIKTYTKPVIIKFNTKAGKEITFNAKKSVVKPVKVSFKKPNNKTK